VEAEGRRRKKSKAGKAKVTGEAYKLSEGLNVEI
jgi:hypothetical protein